MSSTPARTDRAPSTVLVFVADDPARYAAAILDLVDHHDRAVVVAAPDRARLESLGVSPSDSFEMIEAPSAADAVATVATRGTDLFVVTDPVVLPADAVARAELVVGRDLRVATVSFLPTDVLAKRPSGNASGWSPVSELDAQSVTDRLRAVSPEPLPVLTPYAAGGAVMLSAAALALVGSPEAVPDDDGFAAALADFSLRSRARGLLDLLDPGTYVHLETARGVPTRREAGWSEAGWRWLRERHPQLMDGLDAEANTIDRESPLPIAINVARVKTVGLRILIDDTTLGLYETGAQVTTLAIIDTLARHPDVVEVGVALGHDVPEYARTVLERPNVTPMIRSASDYGAFAHFDVLHRTTQPDEMFSVSAARVHARRVVVTILDLIAYRSGGYFATGDDWLAYRDALRRAIAAADGVTTISEDVAKMMQLEALPIERERIWPIPYGTEHLTGTEVVSLPGQLATAELIASEFVLCLGTDYLHKNRDLAIQAHQRLRSRGHDIALVLAGPPVSFGCTREIERQLRRDGDGVIVLVNVRSAERNWLLRHAVAVIYPTSAEGFGLVPFEAARFGTPAVSVGFGPLLETTPDLPVSVATWSADEFANAIDRLLRDPALRQAQVDAIIAAGARYSWDRTVDALLAMYRDLLTRPRR